MDREEWLNRYHEDLVPYRHSYEWYATLPKVTLSAPTGTSQKASIPVPKQRSYTGNMPVIPSALADTLCSDLGIQGLLEKLNTTLCTSHTLFTPWLYSILGDCIMQKWDFGTAFAYIRPFWHYNLTTMVDYLPVKRKAQHQKMLQDVLVKDKIICTHVPPRRVWDLCSNRVVPWWVARRQPWGISHAWVNEEDRKYIMTPINGHEWPAPIPKDTSLDLIRIEMLNLGAEYAWLDVLCLRQKGGIREDLHEEEWKVDVPTIGSVYSNAGGVVCYLSGLGQPLSADADNLESDRCWFKRAWTLQEVSRRPIIGGDTGNKELRVKFEKKLLYLRDQQGWNVYNVLSEMQKRVSTHPVDKIAGMAYLLHSDSIQAYYGKQSEEDAWTALMDAAMCHVDLLFLHPTPGNGTQSWRPSWEQVMTETLPLRLHSNMDLTLAWVQPSVLEDVKLHPCHTDGYIIESALVQGLSNGDKSQGPERWGNLVVKDHTGTEHTFAIVAYHQYPIPDGLYTLLGAESQYGVLCCVVGQRLADQRFKKLSVFEMFNKDQISSLILRGIATKVHTTLLA